MLGAGKDRFYQWTLSKPEYTVDENKMSIFATVAMYKANGTFRTSD